MSTMVDIDAVLSRMDLDEKLAQLGCVWCTALVKDDGFSSVAADRLLAHGIGEITRIGATTGLRPRERASFTNAIQRYLVERTRLGIPAIVHEESTAGLCARDATQFPQAIGLASTWDPELIQRIGVAIREQMVATGARHTLAGRRRDHQRQAREGADRHEFRDVYPDTRGPRTRSDPHRAARRVLVRDHRANPGL